MTFNTNETKLLSFNHHRDPLLVPLEMNRIELPEETSLRLLCLAFARSMDWKVASRKMGFLHRAPRFLTPEAILFLYKSTIRPCMEYCSHISSHGLNLLDQVPKRVVSLLGSTFGLSSDLQALLHRRDVASLSLF